MRTRSAVVIAVASLVVATWGCTDDSIPSAPRSVVPAATVYTATVSPSVILGGLGGSTQNFAYGVNNAGVISGLSAGSVVLWSTGTAVAPTSTAAIPIGFAGRGLDVNAFGQIVGENGVHAALWTPNTGGGYTLTDIGALFPGAIFSTAWAVNAGGKVVGYVKVPENGIPVIKCFLWTPNAPNGTVGTVSVPASDFGAGFCTANDINAAGTIAGASNLPSGPSHAFVWDGSSASGLTDLTPLGDGESYGTSINEGGQVAGWRLTSPTLGGVINAAIWTPSGSSWTVSDLGTFGHERSMAMDINDAGFVVAFGHNVSPLVDDAFFWQNGSASPLLGVPGYQTIPTGALNDATNLGVLLVVGLSVNNTTGEGVALRWAVTLTPVVSSGCLAQLGALVAQMRTDGTLSGGAANSLLAKLDATSRQIDQGHTTPAHNLLSAFINEVNALVASGRLTAAQAQPLLDGAQCAISAL
jgi:probable HAF family extracellular repeat protein